MGKPLLAVGIDPGSWRTRCVICRVDHEQLRLIGFGESYSRGWAKGRVADQDTVSQCIVEAVREAESMARVQVESAVVGIGGAAIEGANSRGIYEFGRPREVEPADLGYAADRATRIRLQEDRLLLQVCPQDFIVDGRAGYRNPKGIRCSRIEANIHVITAAVQEHQFLLSALHQAHLAAEETIFEGMAAAYAATLQDDRCRGLAVVDIGDQSTEVAVYDGEAMIGASSLPIGGERFTKDVAVCLCTSFEDAAHLKEEYGCAILGLTSDNSLIELPSAEGRPPREATRRQLNEVLEARAEELFRYIRWELARTGMEQSLLEGVVLAGGGALLNGMCDVAEKELNCQTRNGLAVGIEDWPEYLDTPAWTVAAGLAMYSARLKLRKDLRRKAPGLAGLVLR